MKYLHTMVAGRRCRRISRLLLCAAGPRRTEAPRQRARAGLRSYSWRRPGTRGAQVELTHNWDPEEYDEGRNFGHLAYEVDDIYALCQKLMDAGVTINRPPRDGRMAFVRSPDNISVELLQKGDALPEQEPWASMPSVGHW